MALIRIREGPGYSRVNIKLPVCHTCKERKPGIFSVDANGKPQCGDCAEKRIR